MQPLLGRASRFVSIADALESLSAGGPDEPLTDIVPGPFGSGPEALANRPEPTASKAA